MTEQTAPTEGTEETTNEHGAEGKEFQAITSQEDFDKAIQSRIARERAKFQDYDQLKASAEKLREFEESQKTEAQKAQERLEAAEKRAATLELQAARAEVAAEKGVPAGLLAGVTREELEASADALIAFKGEGVRKPRVVVHREGNSPTKSNLSPKDEARSEWLHSLRGDDA